MKANELRVGNYVQTDNSTPPHYIDIITVDSILDLGKYGGKINNNHDSWDWDLENIHPIPLTEEWLLKFGFEKLLIGDGNEYLIDVNGLGWSINIKSKYVGFDYLENTEIAKCLYVHQLQNLYFALTGEELQLKELAK